MAIYSAYNSTADIRDAVINGDLNANDYGIMRLRPFSNVTVNGDVFVGNLGLFRVTPNAATVTINGSIFCNGLLPASLGEENAVIRDSVDATCN